MKSSPGLGQDARRPVTPGPQVVFRQGPGAGEHRPDHHSTWPRASPFPRGSVASIESPKGELGFYCVTTGRTSHGGSGSAALVVNLSGPGGDGPGRLISGRVRSSDRSHRSWPKSTAEREEAGPMNLTEGCRELGLSPSRPVQTLREFGQGYVSDLLSDVMANASGDIWITSRFTEHSSPWRRSRIGRNHPHGGRQPEKPDVGQARRSSPSPY